MVRSVLDLDGIDPIDSRLASVGADAAGPRWPSRRLALGLASSPMPAFALLLAGAAAGPHGLNLLTPGVLRALDPATMTATVALGVLIGLDVDLFRRPGAPRMLAAASLEAGLTMVLVWAVFTAVSGQPIWSWPGVALLPLLLGICAAPSGTPAPHGGDSPATRLGDLDDVLPALAGALLLTFIAGSSIGDRLALFATAAGLTVAFAVAGALLVGETAAEGEQRVYAMGVLLLFTGVAAYLSASPLFVGMVGGATWNAVQTAGRDRLARDFRYMQHPIVVLLVIMAGAMAPATLAVAAFGGVFALVRLFGKAVGGAAAASMAPSVTRRFGLTLIAPGAASIAFAATVTHAAGFGTAAEPLLGIVVWGAVLSDVLALLVSWREADQ